MDHLFTYEMMMPLNEKYTGFDTITQAKEAIRNMKNMPDELKAAAIELAGSLTHKTPGQITGLNLHPDLKAKIKEKELPDGFSMGIDKDGYFVHTHRARSKSFDAPGKIGIKEIKFIDSTG